MSCVAIKKINKGWEISADSIRASGWTKNEEKGYHTKLWKLKDLVIGHSGDCQIGNLFREYCETSRPKINTFYGWTTLLADFGRYLSTIDALLKQTSSFIIVYKGKAWYVDDYYVEEIHKVHAIGAGRDFALAALNLGHSAHEAVKIACQLSVYCTEPIHDVKVVD